MYIVDFFKKIVEKKNWIVLVYMALNILVSALALTALSVLVSQVLFLQFKFAEFDYLGTFGVTLIISLVLYAISLLVALSPLGEMIVRKKYKCKKLERADQITYLETIYNEVLGQAKAVDENLSEDAQIYITESAETTVFALGRKTLSFTTGIFGMPQEQVKALLARELGHISQKDTDFLQLVMAGGSVVNMCIWILRISLYVCLVPLFLIAGGFYIFARIGAFVFGTFGTDKGEKAIEKLINLICKPIPWLAKKLFHLVGKLGKALTNGWSKFGVSMVMKTRGASEIAADEFAFNCGYGDVLCDIINNVDLADDGAGIFKDIVMAYPAKDERIAKLQELGVDYSNLLN